MNILDLPLKAIWYDMIESGEKKEEYREHNSYWAKRFYVCLIGREAERHATVHDVFT